MLSGAPPTRQLGYPMMLLNVLTEFCGNEVEKRDKYSEQFKWSVEAILKHVINWKKYKYVCFDNDVTSSCAECMDPPLLC